ncbi:energy transducer TonB [Pedobacter fastidiosus]
MNDEQMLLIVITKENKNKPENLALREKLSKINFATPRFAVDPNFKKPSKDSIPNGTFDFVSVEKQPEFPGGLKAFYQYLGQNIKYPKEAAKNKIYGRVFLSFTVEKNGELTDIKVTRGVSRDIDAEAVRVISESPNWSPGIQFGVPVRVRYNINVNFNLN